jgi:hypothetical protein
VINGRKWWTSGALHPRCRVLIVMGKTDPGAPRQAQQSMIVVPIDTPGVTIVRPMSVFGYLGCSALRRRYRRGQADAGLRPLRFHDLRHTFATTMIGRTSIRRVQEWIGHSDLHSTMKYLPRRDDARLVAEAFAGEDP